VRAVLLLHAVRKAHGSAACGDDTVVKDFRRVLRPLGTVVVVGERAGGESDGPTMDAHDVRAQLDAHGARCREADAPCLVLSFAPLRATPLGLPCPTVPVLGQELGDVTSEGRADASGRGWRSVLRAAGGVIVHSEPAARIVREALGEHFPVAAIPVPVWSRVAMRHDGAGHRPDVAARVVPGVHASLDGRPSVDDGRVLRARVTDAFELATEPTAERPAATAPSPLILHGVVYTAIFDPRDRPTSCEEIVQTFCLSLRDRDDATLVLGPISGTPAVRRRVASLLTRLRPFRCRVVVVDAVPPGHASAALARASTYTISASSPDGPSVAPMEYMSYGRPAIALRHPGLEDYVDETNAFLVEPRDPGPMDDGARYPLSADSLMAAFRESHRVACEEPERYLAMSRSAVESLRRHCSDDIVREKLVRLLLPRVRASGFPEFTFGRHGAPWPGPIRKLYSQGNEELVVRDFFGDARGGVFVDVGCANPIVGSTTCFLERHLGWSGIGVDALPEYAPAYERERPRTRFVHAIVTDRVGPCGAFYRVRAAPDLSTTDPTAHRLLETAVTERLEVPTTTLDALLDEHAVAAIDFLSIDVEHGERRLLAGFDLGRFAPRLVCIERASAPREILDYFTHRGYERIDRYRRYDPVNWYFRPVATA